MSPAAIYGRDAELEQLRQLVARRRSFLLHGPAGVGKTLLLKHLAGEVPEMRLLRRVFQQSKGFSEACGGAVCEEESPCAPGLRDRGSECHQGQIRRVAPWDRRRCFAWSQLLDCARPLAISVPVVCRLTEGCVQWDGNPSHSSRPLRAHGRCRILVADVLRSLAEVCPAELRFGYGERVCGTNRPGNAAKRNKPGRSDSENRSLQQGESGRDHRHASDGAPPRSTLQSGMSSFPLSTSTSG